MLPPSFFTLMFFLSTYHRPASYSITAYGFLSEPRHGRQVEGNIRDMHREMKEHTLMRHSGFCKPVCLLVIPICYCWLSKHCRIKLTSRVLIGLRTSRTQLQSARRGRCQAHIGTARQRHSFCKNIYSVRSAFIASTGGRF